MGNCVEKIGEMKVDRIGLFIATFPEWSHFLNIIRRGRRRKNQGDLDMANSMIVPKLVEFGVWDGEKGEPIDKDFCDELWQRMKILTEEQEVF